MAKEGCAIDVVKKRVRLLTWSKKSAPIYVVNDAYIRVGAPAKKSAPIYVVKCGQRTWSKKSAPIYVVKEGRLYTWSKKGAPRRGQKKGAP